MLNTFTQLHIQFVFAVKYRAALIDDDWRARLHQYMTAIIQLNGHKLLQENSMVDHIHIFVGLRPQQAISALIQNLKTETSKWVNSARLTNSTFAWQEGCGAFSYSHSHVQNVIRYIQNQEIHHKKETLLVEYKKLLKAFEIDYDE